MKCEDFFAKIRTEADEIGLQVNEKKTQLLCVSTSSKSDVDSYICLQDGSKIESQRSLKVVGFHFSNRPTVDEI